MVSPTQLSVLRMVPIARRIARAGAGDLAVFRLLNSVRGWDTEHTPVNDVEWALAQVRARLGAEVPICLVGHSLGGRAGVLSAGHDDVHSVVALAPWVYPTDGRIDARGRQILIVHGELDRIAHLSSAVVVADDLRRTARVGFITIPGGKHAMLRHHRLFDSAAADYAVGTLLGRRTPGPVSDILDGTPQIRL